MVGCDERTAGAKEASDGTVTPIGACILTFITHDEHTDVVMHLICAVHDMGNLKMYSTKMRFWAPEWLRKVTQFFSSGINSSDAGPDMFDHL